MRKELEIIIEQGLKEWRKLNAWLASERLAHKLQAMDKTRHATS